MTLNSHWRARATAAHRAPTDTRSKSQRDFDNVFVKLSKTTRPVNDACCYVHFCDDTAYSICKRYGSDPHNIASAELRLCAAIVVPTSDTLTAPADCYPAERTCMRCCRVLHKVITSFDGEANLDRRLIWSDYKTGSIVAADPYGVNLARLADIMV